MSLVPRTQRRSLIATVSPTCVFGANTMIGFSRRVSTAVGSYTGGSPNVYRLPVNVSDVLGITSERYAVVTGGSAIYVIKLPED